MYENRAMGGGPLQLRPGDKTLALGAGSTLGADAGALVDLGGLPAAANLVSAAEAQAALSGGGQAGATPIQAKLTRFVTCAADHDSSVLPPAKPGIWLVVANASAHVLDVYGAGADVINAIASLSPFSIAAGKAALFAATSAGQWSTILTA